MPIEVKRTCALTGKPLDVHDRITDAEFFELSDDTGGTYQYSFRMSYEHTGGGRRHRDTVFLKLLPARDDAHAKEIGHKIASFLESIMDIKVSGVYPTLVDSELALRRFRAEVISKKNRFERYRAVQRPGGIEFVRK